MQEIKITENQAGQRFDKFLFKYFKEATSGFIYKMLRKKNIVLNGKKSDGKEKLNVGDSIKIFMADDTILKFRGEIKLDIVKPIDLDIVYEDDNILINCSSFGYFILWNKRTKIKICSFLNNLNGSVDGA